MTHRRALYIILLFALIVRLGWGLSRPTHAAAIEALPDQREYLLAGRNIAAGLGLQFFDPRFSDVVIAYRTPGYPFLIAACGGSVNAVRIVQALLDTSTILAVFLLARVCTRNETLAVIAAAIAAVNPLAIYFSALILTETLFTAMLVWGMYLLARLRNFVWGGIVLELAILVRPSAIALPVVLGLASLAVNYRTKITTRLRWPLPIAATMILLTILVIVPWGIRNKLALGHWIWTTTNEGITAYDGFGPDATGASDQRFVEFMPWLSRMSEVERNEYLSKLARDEMKKDWGRVARLAIKKIARTWSPVPLSAEYGSLANRMIAAGYSLPLFALTLIGLLRSPMAGGVKLYLLLPALYFTAVHALSVGSLRYRYPAEPLLAVLAAAGVIVLVENARPLAFRRTKTEAGVQ